MTVEPVWIPRLASDEDALEPLSAARLAKPPPKRDWMIEGCFSKGTVGLIAGAGGIGKSLVCQQLASCAVIGHSWLELAVAPGRALYLGCEDDQDELHRRQWNINRELGFEMDDLIDAGLHLIPRVARDNRLMYLDKPRNADWRMQRTTLMDRLVEYCCEAGIQYVFLDTATKTFGGNQNDERQVSDYISEMQRLAIAIQGVVILLKQPSATGRANGTGESGSVQWENSVRSRLYLAEDKAKGITTLRGMKQNYGRKLEPIVLEYRRGVFVRQEPEVFRRWQD